MPIANLDDVEEASEGNFEPIPAGKYHAKTVEAELKTSQAGDEYINYKLEISEGQYSGRFVWDSVFFTDKSKGRLKLVVSRLLGIKPIGDTDFQPDMFVGKTCWVEVVQDNYMDKNGDQKIKNIVTFAGYLSDKEENDMQENPNNDLPF